MKTDNRIDAFDELDAFVESLEKGTWTPQQANAETKHSRVATLEAEPCPDRNHWPHASLDAERRFGQPHARLIPLLGRKVWTPQGSGTLLSAFAEQCEVLPDGAAKTIRVRNEDVLPLPIQ